MSFIKKPAICLDLDDVVFDFLGHLCFLFNRINKCSISPNDINTWDIDDTIIEDASGRLVKGKEILDIMHRFSHHSLYGTMPLLSNVKQAIETMFINGYSVIFITARPKEVGEDTYLAFLNNELQFTEIIFEWDKAKVINELSNRYDIKMFVDDKRETVNVVAEKCNVETICIMNKAHNRTGEVNEKIKRIDTLTECIKYVK